LTLDPSLTLVDIPFLENVLRHLAFLSGNAKTSFIEHYSKDLFNFEGHGSLRSSKVRRAAHLTVQARVQRGRRPSQLLMYLAEMVVNGADHPRASEASHDKKGSSQILIPCC
jgi:pyruvate carboxylase